MDKGDLIGYFRTTDKTSDSIGSRQAAVFRAFAGHAEADTESKSRVAAKPKEKPARAPSSSKSKRVPIVIETNGREKHVADMSKSRDMALTVRIEINLPADGTRDTYDNIFQSIRANLLNE